jgi:hypothetical protein
MMNMKHEWKILIDLMIKRARTLNEMRHKSASQPLPGTEFLHDMLRDKVFSRPMYDQLRRLAEDSSIEYKIIE